MATGSDRMLPGGGYDVDFIESLPSSLECPVCLLALREPNILSCCGIKVCFTCIDQIKLGGKGCPICRESDFDIMLEKQLYRKILGMKVYCRYKGNGCDWEGELRNQELHEDVEGNGSDASVKRCRYVMVQCKYGCSKSLMRHEVEGHELKECSNRPIETQVYQLREIIEQMRAQHAKEIGELKSCVDSQEREIGELKLRIDELEETKANKADISFIPPPPPPPAPPPPAPPPFSGVTWVGSHVIPNPPPPPPAPRQYRTQHPFRHPVSSRSLPVLATSTSETSNSYVIDVKNGHKLSLVYGDVTQQEVDVIVCSAGSELKLTTGVSQSLNNASQGYLQHRCNRLVLHSGELSHGDVVSVPAGGKLRCSHVVFVRPPFYHGWQPDFFKKCVVKCLDKVEALDAKSVAFTAVGISGVGKSKPDLVAGPILEVLSNYSYLNLVDIRIVELDKEIHDVFLELIKEKRARPTTTHASSRRRIMNYLRMS